MFLSERNPSNFHLQVCAAFSIWLGFVAEDKPIFAIMGEIGGFALDKFIFWFCILLGIILIFVMICGLCTAWKRFLCCHWIFAIIVIFSSIFFLALGLALIILSQEYKKELTKLCSDGQKNSDFQKAFAELYDSADTIYCKAAPYNCVCYVKHVVTSANITTSLVELPTTIRNVQQ